MPRRFRQMEFSFGFPVQFSMTRPVSDPAPLSRILLGVVPQQLTRLGVEGLQNL